MGPKIELPDAESIPFSGNLGIIFGLNTLDRLFEYGFIQHPSTIMHCMTFNANLDYVVKLFESYPTLGKLVLFANNEKIVHSGKNTDKIVSLIKNGQLAIHYMSGNQQILHSKIYAFYNETECTLVAVGSPNLTHNSNRSIESLLIVRSPIPNEILETWNNVPSSLQYKLQFEPEQPPPFVFTQDMDSILQLDTRITRGLWEHQRVILEWLSNKRRSIVNIPPGTGKTTIGLRYLSLLASKESDLTTIVLVPTLTLVSQWLEILRNASFDAFEGGTTSESLEEYLCAPEGRILVTLYSRFWKLCDKIALELCTVNAPCLLIADECHNLYTNFARLNEFTEKIEREDIPYYHIGLSATIDTFQTHLMDDYLSYCGGEESRFNISLPSFYNLWNDLNPGRPILKEIEYKPYLCRLTSTEMEEYNRLTQKVGMQSSMKTLEEGQNLSAAIERARFVRSTSSGVTMLKEILDDSISEINKRSSIIFVQTNEIAEAIRSYITSHNQWDLNASAYVYDSSRNDQYLNYAMEKFRKNQGFCLVAERMLAEGFDLPSISLIMLHGSYTSERDWIQKIGRAIRYDPLHPNDFAKIIDIVFCTPKGSVLPMERERYDTLLSISN